MDALNVTRNEYLVQIRNQLNRIGILLALTLFTLFTIAWKLVDVLEILEGAS